MSLYLQRKHLEFCLAYVNHYASVFLNKLKNLKFVFAMSEMLISSSSLSNISLVKRKMILVIYPLL